MEAEVLFQVRWEGMDAPQVITVLEGFDKRDEYWPKMQIGIRNAVDQKMLKISDLVVGDLITLTSDNTVEFARYEQ